MSDFRFKCPHCGLSMVGDSELEAQPVTCPDCAHEFTPKVPAIAPAPIGYKAPKPERKWEVKVTPAKSLKQRQAEIHGNADALSTIAVIIAVIGLIAAAVIGSNYGSGIEFVIAFGGTLVSFLAVSLWLYLIAQIMHIRASLMRLDK